MQTPPAQGVPSSFCAARHVPSVELQNPTWHSPGDGQSIGLAPTQTPPWHVSSCVQALASLHRAPSGVVGSAHSAKVQTPPTQGVPGAQCSGPVQFVRHAPAAHPKGAQSSGPIGWQAPLASHTWDVFSVVPEQRAGPQVAPLGLAGVEQAPL